MRQSSTRFGILFAVAIISAVGCGGGNSSGTPPESSGNGGGGGSGSGGKTGGSGTGGQTGGGTGGMTGNSAGGQATGAGGSGKGGTAAGGSGSGAGGTGSGAGGTSGPADPDAGAGGTGTPNAKGAVPFGSHIFKYPDGTILPTGAQADLDKAVAAAYDKWIDTYLKPLPACNGMYVLSGGGTGIPKGSITQSEAHGYGMLLTALMHGHDPKAQERFDGLYRTFRAVPSINNVDLIANAFDMNCKGTSALDPKANDGAYPSLPDTATDGDLDLAFSLLLADRQWGSAGTINYLAEGKKVIAAIKAHDINAETNLTLLGDWADIKADYYEKRYGAGSPFGGPYGGKSHKDFYYGTRSSDFMIDHFKAFGAASGDVDGWNKVVDATYAVVARIQGQFSSNTGLLPGFIEAKTVATAAPARGDYLEASSDGAWDYNACRDPWRLGTDWIATGDQRAKTAVTKMNDWVKKATGGEPGNIKDGYQLNGTGTGGAADATFIAPFGVAAMVDASNQAWLDKIWNRIKGSSNGYFPDSIAVLSMVVMSGNWWQP